MTKDGRTDQRLLDVVYLYNDMRAVFKEDSPCEVPDHSGEEHHSGAGTWYVVDKCPHCKESQVTLVCEQFCNFLRTVLDTHDAPCSGCHIRVKLRDGIVRFEKKGK